MLHTRIANALYAKTFSLLFRNKFGSYGSKSSIVFPVCIEGQKNIHIGARVYIATHSCLVAHNTNNSQNSCELRIGDGCKIGRFNHIYATQSITLGKNVLTANGVYISDNLHDYKNPEIPIIEQKILQKEHVSIGDDSWIGHNACIIGVKIGKHCVIGANSVVTRDIPDYCVAAGVPANIIKRLDLESGKWKRTTPNGEFA